MEAARYLLENPSSDAASLSKAKALVSLVESHSGAAEAGGALGIQEQDQYPAETTDATARYARVCALIAAATNDPVYRAKAARAVNLVTYGLVAKSGARAGQIGTGPNTDRFNTDLTAVQWLRASHTDTIPHLIAIMSLLPDMGTLQP
jgi:hypothetical protein